ncbi:MAG TPA: hypothetical protein VGL41_08415 [Roseiarcus sp.]|jgi:hypothetical protein
MAGKVREVIEPEGDKFGDFHLFWRLGPAHLGAIVFEVTPTRLTIEWG